MCVLALAGSCAAASRHSSTAFVQLATAGDLTCARTDAGEIWCWGDNTSGQLGDGIVLRRTTPVLDRVACP